MALDKRPLDINFALGLDTKTDPKQVQAGKFLELVNTVFTKAGQWTKRNGFQPLAALPTNDIVTATTLSGNLVAVGSSFQALSADTNLWMNKGPIQPIDLSITPQVRTNSSQLTVDTAIASNGLSCTVWYDSDTLSYYRVTDSATGQVIVDTTALAADAGATVGPKVFCLGTYFVIVYWQTVTGTPTLRLLALAASNPSLTGTVKSISTGASITAAFDGVVDQNGYLYMSLQSAATTLTTLYITQTLTVSGTKSITSVTPSNISVTADSTNLIWLTWYNASASTIRTAAYYKSSLAPFLTNTLLVSSTGTISGLTSSAYGGILTVLYDKFDGYSYTPNSPHTASNRSDNISKTTYNSNTSAVGTPSLILRSVGLASKAFRLASTGTIYFLTTYGGLMQPTYFLSDSSGNVLAKLAYGNGAGYLPSTTLPQANVDGDTVKIGYLFKALTTPVNKATNLAANSQVSGIYNQIGINLASFAFYQGGVGSAELAGSLQLTGGFMWQYDGVKPVEHSFHLYPEDLQSATTTSTFGRTCSTTNGSTVITVDVSAFISVGELATGSGIPASTYVVAINGLSVTLSNAATATATLVVVTFTGEIPADTYFYVACYEWTDAQGLIHRSAPSVPITQVTTTTNSINTIKVPTLRLTYKTTPNPVRIVIYRWSVLLPVYYQITSVTNPIVNNPSVDSITYYDGSPTTTGLGAIIGNTILYTNGGTVENIAAPAITAMAPFNTRLFAISAEDQNLLLYSKQVIENTPVEMSDLFTIYVAPTISANGSTGPMKCVSAMDDKLIIFKDNAAYYITGTGPDNTGANNDFSNATFITSTVGCSNPRSIVFTPKGLMFQSDKGIWILGRDLSTEYIGAPVEEFNDFEVLSANAIPGTNQVRFRLSNGIALMYDYYYNQWGTFQGISGVSSTIYQGLETVITASQTVTPPVGAVYSISPQVYQETPGSYLDGTNPVLMRFKTGWISLAGIQGFERFYQLLFLGTYISPFKLQTDFAYNFNSSVTQSVPVTPETPGPVYGLAPGPYGSGSFGGNSTAFKARVFPTTQKCESFQVTAQEIYDPQYDIAPGAGLTLSGMQLLIGVKKGTRTSSAARSFG